MRETPRTRRLHSDLKALEQLAADSTIFSFQPYGTPPDFYILRFNGRGFWKRHPQDEPVVREEHDVHIRLGAAYPRMMPELAWKSPIFHPNISSSGVVCLGGYGTHWAPSLALDELCGMLWDMIRYENYDETSPYNREAAGWAKHQTDFPLPIDERPLRNKLTGKVKEEPAPPLVPMSKAKGVTPPPAHRSRPLEQQPSSASIPSGVLFIGEVEVVEAQVVASAGLSRRSRNEDVLFIQ